MKKLFNSTILFSIIILLTSCCSKKDLTCCDNKWEPLFNDDLSNAVYDKSAWSLHSDGVLRSTEDKIIFTTQDYENFELELEFRIEKESNSGIVIYCSDVQKWIPNSLEIQIADSSSKKFGKPYWNCGCIFGHVNSEFDTKLSFGQWHKMLVRANGQQIDVFLNGKHVSKMNMAEWTNNKITPTGEKILPWLNKHKKSEMQTKGRIGLQGKHGGATTDFKNIRIRKISNCKICSTK